MMRLTTIILLSIIIITVFNSCKSIEPVKEIPVKGIRLKVDVYRSVMDFNSPEKKQEGTITFYDDNSFTVNIKDVELKDQLSSIMGRIIAEGRAPYPGLYNSKNQQMMVRIGERGFLRALLYSTKNRLNAERRKDIIRFRYSR